MKHRLTHGSLFSGIGGFDLGFERAGFRTLWAVEKEPFCQAVATLNSGGNSGGFRTEPGEHLVSAKVDSDRMRNSASLPPGLDSARYRALGNAVTVPVAEWIARRIKAVLERDEL